MVTPIPTPFDITEIPVIPWVPRPTEWITLLALTCVALIASKLVMYTQTKARVTRVAQRLLAEMQERFDTDWDLPIAWYSRSARRIAERLTERPLTGLSSYEITSFASESSDPLEQRALILLATLDSASYAAPSSHDKTKSRDTLRELLVALRQLLERAEGR